MQNIVTNIISVTALSFSIYNFYINRRDEKEKLRIEIGTKEFRLTDGDDFPVIHIKIINTGKKDVTLQQINLINPYDGKTIIGGNAKYFPIVSEDLSIEQMNSHRRWFIAENIDPITLKPTEIVSFYLEYHSVMISIDNYNKNGKLPVSISVVTSKQNTFTEDGDI